MKTLYSILALCVIFLISSCNECKRKVKETETEKGQGIDISIIDSPKVNSSRVGNVVISPNKLVVQFPDDMPEAKKEKFRKAVSATVDSTCSCGNSPIELWEINIDSIDIDEAKRQTTSTGEDDGVRGDHQFNFKVPHFGKDLAAGGSFLTGDDIFPTVLGSHLISSSEIGNRVNIAVVDTGLDFGQVDDSDKFLYSTLETLTGCDGFHTSGWNFVDGNPDIRDSHKDGHGTFVTKTLMRELEASDVAYSILPIKAFDGAGKGSYWNIICAFNYIKEIQAENGDLHIVNASFGYGLPVVDQASNEKNVKDYNKESILAALIADLKNNTIVVASAGNDNQNTDQPENAHFPSGFTSPRLISVGGYALYKSFGGNVSKMIKGNYGPTSVDLMAPYQHLFFSESNGDLGQDGVLKQGTSFGAPFTSAILAKFISNGNNFETPTLLRQSFLDSDFLLKDPIFTNKVNEGRYIESDAYINNPHFVVPVYDNQVLKNADE